MQTITVWKAHITAGKQGVQELTFSPFEGTLDIATQLLPGGAFTTFRTYQVYKALYLKNHFQRLERSAQLSSVPLTLEQDALRQALRALIATQEPLERRVRVTLDLERQVGAVYFALEALQIPDEASYQNGARAVTCQMERQNAQAKLTSFIAQASKVRRTLPEGVNEALMINPQGQILEGLSSNFFVVRDGVIFTAGESVLQGITRLIVLDEIEKVGIPLNYAAIAAENISQLDEAFITSSSRGILPVVYIDRTQIGSGKPGPVTKKLMKKLEQRIQEEIEDI